MACSSHKVAYGTVGLLDVLHGVVMTTEVPEGRTLSYMLPFCLFRNKVSKRATHAETLYFISKGLRSSTSSCVGPCSATDHTVSNGR